LKHDALFIDALISGMTETPLQSARRQVEQGRDLIAKQQALLDALFAGRNSNLLQSARATLIALRAGQRLSEELLARLEQEGLEPEEVAPVSAET
jgi:hypothetical protein